MNIKTLYFYSKWWDLKNRKKENTMQTLPINMCHHRRTKYWAPFQILVSSLCRIEGRPLWGHGPHLVGSSWIAGGEPRLVKLHLLLQRYPASFQVTCGPGSALGSEIGDLWMPKSAFLAPLNHSKASQSNLAHWRMILNLSPRAQKAVDPGSRSHKVSLQILRQNHF